MIGSTVVVQLPSSVESVQKPSCASAGGCRVRAAHEDDVRQHSAQPNDTRGAPSNSWQASAAQCGEDLLMLLLTSAVSASSLTHGGWVTSLSWHSMTRALCVSARDVCCSVTVSCAFIVSGLL